MAFIAKGTMRACGYVLICLLLAGLQTARAQSVAAPAQAGTQADLDTRLRALTDSLDQTRVELSESRAEIRELRGMLEQLLKKEGGQPIVAADTAPQPAQSPSSSGEERPAQIGADDWQIVNARVAELEQDKVGSASRYRIKLSGLVLLNLSGVSGQVDNTDVPSVATPTPPGAAPGSVGASLRQTIIGLSGLGPDVFGARTSANLQMDFFGGLPAGYGSETSGLMRLRVARIRFDWTNTSVVAGLDVPFFSPNMPTTYLTVAEPAFAASGNLWAWAPTIRVEHRFDTNFSQIKVEAGFIDVPVYSDEVAGQRTPSPGESSRQPTYAVRVSANGRDENQPMSFGVSGIFSPQTYQYKVGVSGWGAVGDWKFPILRRLELNNQGLLELSGQIFIGRGLDGFGGVPTIPTTAEYYSFGVPVAANLEQITMFGGWTQLKYKLNSRSEFNAAVGMGGRDSSEMRQLGDVNSQVSYLSPRNQMFLANYIFRPRSNLLLSPEFRRLRTYPLTGAPAVANQFGLSAGYLF
ncbi:MAG: hypothetical protein WA734_20310 [Candidatus Acidiferrales bacterium]